MQNHNASFFLSLSSAFVLPFLLLGTVAFFFVFDLGRMRRERRSVWYQRPLVLLGLAGIVWELSVLLQISNVSLVFAFLPVFLLEMLLNLLLLALIIAIVIMLMLHNRDRVFLFALMITALVLHGRNSDRESALKQEISTLRRRLVSRVESSELIDTRSALIGGVSALVSFTFLIGMLQQIESLPSAREVPFADGWTLLALVLLLVYCMVLVTRADIRLSILQGIARRRILLAAEESSTSPPIIEQASQELASQFALAIILQLKRMPLCFWFVVVLSCIIFGFLSLFHLDAPYHVPVAATFAIYGGVNFALQIVFSLNDCKTVQMTDGGLKVVRKEKFATKERSIAWSEAQRFVCYKLPSLFLGRETIVYYELSGLNSIVTWTWVLDPQSPLTLWKPQLPIDEYHRQMQALCELITAKTGLTLHDLSKALSAD